MPLIHDDVRRFLRRAAPAGAAVAALLVLSHGTAQAPPGEAQEEQALAGEGLDYPKWQTSVPGEHDAYNRRANLIQRGRLVYLKYCVGCHGEAGDGNGPAAVRLLTKPRDFTSGIYKFRSTDSGSLPLESDLYRTITRGLSRVSMPAFPLMPEREKLAVIEYVKGFYPAWQEEQGARRIVPVPLAPSDLDDPQRARRGRFVYLDMQCSQCHGVDGRGTGATQTEYTDAWGHPQKPFDFTRGNLKSGNAPEDIYRTFHTGLRSIMPAFDGPTLALTNRGTFEARKESLDAAERAELEQVAGEFPATAGEVFAMDAAKRRELAERNSWDLVAYILSLRDTTTTAEAVLGPRGVSTDE